MDKADVTIQRHACWLEYNGTAYHGSQFQRRDADRHPTIEGELRRACAALHLPLTGAITLAGRTDAGVHALGQVAHMSAPAEAVSSIRDLANALNAHLPADISVREVALNVGMDFHARARARWRWYRYTLLNRRQRSATAPFNVCLERRALDVARMDAAARYLVGTHAFGSFQAPGSLTQDDQCRVAYAAVWQNEDLINFDIVAARFLYKMVRNLMGLLIAIGGAGPEDADRYAPDILLDLLGAPDRTRAASLAPCARPEGLSLMAVSYAPDYDLFPHNPLVRRLRETLIKESVSP
ncbi:MAG: tRNA pseudouridine(38-40) synthase TruA [Vampirovibrionales bacterium]|nr:tRNA pseudouridine(38-40) synthase TruA [Vampirovibrionales bacterium]